MTRKDLTDELAAGIPWRPKLFVRNPNYPKVGAKGYKFTANSGGFHLYHRKSGKYIGHYTKADIAELERKYARKPYKKTRAFKLE